MPLTSRPVRLPAVKIETVATAQRAGLITDRIPASDLFAIVARAGSAHRPACSPQPTATPQARPHHRTPRRTDRSRPPNRRPRTPHHPGRLTTSAARCRTGSRRVRPTT
ncbi:hypothetical protein [Saccharopolyspora sp. 5N708]|uniref:hypothetical protein n=1 Tax=Saccharopolyspora sp. 5N708 TaxID=3457424 RepID=UPI003FD093BE